METEPKKRRRRRFSEQDRLQLIAAWRKSGESASKFAESRGVHASNLWRWASALEQAEETPSKAAARPTGFVELRVDASAGRAVAERTDVEPAPQFQIEGPFGLRVRVYPGADVETLTRLLAALPGSGRC
jgi:transposase